MELFIGSVFAGITIYIANLVDIGQKTRWLRPILSAWCVAIIMSAFMSLSAAVTEGAVDIGTGILEIVSLIMGAGAFWLLASDEAKTRLADFLNGGREEPRFKPHSAVHLTAVILSFAITAYIFLVYALLGGLAGIADALNASDLSIVEVFLNGIVYVLAALLGVGYLIRRDTKEMLRRLGLRWPTLQDWRAGIGMGILLYIFFIIASILWFTLVSPEMLEQQTNASQQVFAAFSGSLLTGLLLALATGIGEEILFRGALQPVFGIWMTSIFFMFLHLQYAFTPASLIILGVSLGFGYLRKRYSTSAAILAHIIYNFIPFVLLEFAGPLIQSG